MAVKPTQTGPVAPRAANPQVPVELSTTKAQILPARPYGRRVLVQNLDDTNGLITGTEDGVEAGAGLHLGAGSSGYLNQSEAVWAVAVAGTPSVSVNEE